MKCPMKATSVIVQLKAQGLVLIAKCSMQCPVLIIELADCHKYFTEIPNWTIKKQINPCIDLSSLNAKLLNMVSQYVHNK